MLAGIHNPEPIGVVIECGWAPRRGCMARFAGMDELVRRVIEPRGNCEVGLVATVAVLVHQLEVVVDVACLAGLGHVSTRQREPSRCMVERRRRPSLHRMTGQAGCGE